MRESEIENEEHRESEPTPPTAGFCLRYEAESLRRHSEAVGEGESGPNAYQLEDLLKTLAEAFDELPLSPIERKLLSITVGDLNLRTVDEIKTLKRKGLEIPAHNDEDPFLLDHINATILQVYTFLEGIRTRKASQVS
jgi:hypothetical protein